MEIRPILVVSCLLLFWLGVGGEHNVYNNRFSSRPPCASSCRAPWFHVVNTTPRSPSELLRGVQATPEPLGLRVRQISDDFSIMTLEPRAPPRRDSLLRAR
jgi:hypothetical protein